MKRIMKHAVAALALVGASGAAQAGIVNVLDNAGFEAGVMGPWYQGLDFSPAGEDWNVTAADAHTGTYSATDTGNKEILQDFAAVSVDDILEVSFWARHIGAGTALAVTFEYSDGSREENAVFTVTDGWEFFDVTHFLDAGKELVTFGIFGNSAGCDADCTRTYFDDTLVAVAGSVPVPASVALMGLGLAGMGYRRYRKAR